VLKLETQIHIIGDSDHLFNLKWIFHLRTRTEAINLVTTGTMLLQPHAAEGDAASSI
jgi:hypothetical protein